jgi:hypothetical protein
MQTKNYIVYIIMQLHISWFGKKNRQLIAAGFVRLAIYMCRKVPKKGIHKRQQGNRHTLMYSVV